MRQNPRQHPRRNHLGDRDEEYNRIRKAREEYESSLSHQTAKRTRTKRAGPVTVRQGERTWKMPDYETYIASRGWEKRRSDYFSKHARRCMACGAEKKIHLHHKTYVRMGHELDEDLVPLCESCHSKVHTIYNRGGRKLSQVTDQFVKKGYLAQKKSKSKSKKALKANSREKIKAQRAKSEKVISHKQNPVQKTSPDVAPKKVQTQKVRVTSPSGETRTESDWAIRQRGVKSKSDPQWVRKAKRRR